MSRTFKSFTELDVSMHNARVAAGKGDGLVAPTDDAVTAEADLHRQILDFCRQRRWFVVHSRMDMPTTCAIGTTDFVIAADNAKTYWIEAKAKGKKLTREQEGTLHWLQSLGHRAEVVYSLGQFMDVVNKDVETTNQAKGKL